jgi:hypothetical protein
VLQDVLSNGGEVFFTLHAPFILLILMELVDVSWWTMCIFMRLVRKAGRILARQNPNWA